jgi:hypothetical protein
MTPQTIANILELSITMMKINSPCVKKHDSDIPAIRGQEGEKKFEQIIKKAGNGFEIENVSKCDKSGDFIIKRQGRTGKLYKLLIDIKNYKTTVSSKEIKKLYRDVDINNVSGGMMISLQSKIAGVSQMLQLDNFTNNIGEIPIVLMKSDNELVIMEVIKLIFHIMEIRDLNNNKVQKHNCFINSINQLHDNVQMIMDSREILRICKHDMDKNLDDIMMKLMECEYKLILRINQINQSLEQQHITNTDINDAINTKEQTEEENNPFKSIIQLFGKNITDEIEILLFQIFEIKKWVLSVDIPTKKLTLKNNDCYIIIKFSKTPVVSFPSINTDMIPLLNKIKKSASGVYCIKLIPKNMEKLLLICKEV